MNVLRRLERSMGDGRPAAPVRIVHLGLGQFFRSHVAWYTDAAPDCADWGIAAFTGQSADLARLLTEQGGLYTLIVRGPEADTGGIVSSISMAKPGTDVEAFNAAVALPDVAIITLTVTEAGYTPIPAGTADGDARVTVAGRLVTALAARRDAGGGKLAIVPCDNVPHNGAVLASIVGDAAARLDPALLDWIDDNVSWVTTVCDRVTPGAVDQDQIAAHALTGRTDTVPVTTEPFTDWVLSGEFPAGRPQWEEAGARFVDDIVPDEQRKLWLVNGGNSLMAYVGSARHHVMVHEAVADPEVRALLDEWWDEASRHVAAPTGDLDAVRQALIERFSNPRIAHPLAQIATDGSQKLPVRVVEVIRGERAAGRIPNGAVAIVAAWVDHLRGVGAPVTDVDAATVVPLAAGPIDDAAERILGYLAGDLALDRDLVDAVASRCTTASAR